MKPDEKKRKLNRLTCIWHDICMKHVWYDDRRGQGELSVLNIEKMKIVWMFEGQSESFSLGFDFYGYSNRRLIAA